MKILIPGQLYWHMVENKRALWRPFIEILKSVNESTFLSTFHGLHILLPQYWVQYSQRPEEEDGSLSEQERIFSYKAIKSRLGPVRCLLWEVTGDQSTEILPTTLVIRC